MRIIDKLVVERRGLWQRFVERFKSERETWLILFMILILAAFLRLSFIGTMNVFWGDSARDCIVVRQLITQHVFPLLGPAPHYYGSIWYYILSVPFFISSEPEVGCVYVGLLNVVAVFLCYKLGKELFDKKAGLIASALYAVSPSAVLFSNAIWNPDILPLFTILTFYSASKLIKGESRYLPAFFASLAVTLQLHLTAIALIPTFAVLFLIFRPRIRLKHLSLGLIVFTLLFAPFIYYEFTHDFTHIRYHFPSMLVGPRNPPPLQLVTWKLLMAVMDMTCGSWIWYSDRALWYGTGVPYGNPYLFQPWFERFGVPSPPMLGWHLFAYWVNYVELALFFIVIPLLFFYVYKHGKRNSLPVILLLLWFFVPLLVLNYVRGFHLHNMIPYQYVLLFYPMQFLSIAFLLDQLYTFTRRIQIMWRGHTLKMFKGKSLFRLLVPGLVFLIVSFQALECVTVFSQKPGSWYPWSTLKEKEEAVRWVIEDSGDDFKVTYVVQYPESYEYLFTAYGATPNDQSKNLYIIVDPPPTPLREWEHQLDHVQPLINKAIKMHQVGPIRIYFIRL